MERNGSTIHTRRDVMEKDMHVGHEGIFGGD